jgi:hypothetical protein
VAITHVGKMNSPVLTWRLYARTSPSLTVGNPSSNSQTTTRARHARRMAWSAAHGLRQFPMRQWRRVFFTDESRFTLFRPDGRRRAYRRLNKMAAVRVVS